jgi:hypothetical protein
MKKDLQFEDLSNPPYLVPATTQFATGALTYDYQRTLQAAIVVDWHDRSVWLTTDRTGEVPTRVYQCGAFYGWLHDVSFDQHRALEVVRMVQAILLSTAITEATKDLVHRALLPGAYVPDEVRRRFDDDTLLNPIMAKIQREALQALLTLTPYDHDR